MLYDVCCEDSGGFQIYSLAAMRKFTDEGVVFQSHIDAVVWNPLG